MRRITFPRRAIGPNETYQLEVPAPGIVRAIDLRFSGTYTSSGANGGGHLDTAFGPWGTFSFYVGNRRVIEMEAVDWRHLTAVMQGEYAQLEPALSILDTTAGGQNGPAPFLAQGRLDFQRIIPRQTGFNAGMLVEARNQKPIFKGRTIDAPRLGSTVTNFTAELDASIEVSTLAKAPKYLWPDIYQERYRIDQVSNSLKFTHTFNDLRCIAAIMIRVVDADKVRGANPNIGRSDTLVRAAKLQHKRNGGRRVEVIDETRWFDLNQQGTRQYGMSTQRNGIYIHGFDDPDTDETDVLWVHPGEELTFGFDTGSAVDQRFTAIGSTDSVVAANDEVVVTFVTGIPVGFDRVPTRSEE